METGGPRNSCKLGILVLLINAVLRSGHGLGRDIGTGFGKSIGKTIGGRRLGVRRKVPATRPEKCEMQNHE